MHHAAPVGAGSPAVPRVRLPAAPNRAPRHGPIRRPAAAARRAVLTIERQQAEEQDTGESDEGTSRPSAVRTDIHVGRLDSLLKQCPLVKPATRRTVIDRLRNGADIGYMGNIGGRFMHNNRSANLRVRGVSAAIEREVSAGFTRGPFQTPPLDNFVVNPLSARDKPSGEVRLILNLSQPASSAVNDGVDRDESRVTYSSVDEAIRLIFAAGGEQAQMFKADIKDAFKLVPVRPEQWRLLVFVGRDQSHHVVLHTDSSRWGYGGVV